MKKISLVILIFAILIFLKDNIFFQPIKKNPSKVKEKVTKEFLKQKVVNPDPYGIRDIEIEYLRSIKFNKNLQLTIEEELDQRPLYKRYIATYNSEGNKIYGLLTIPKDLTINYPAIVFNHGYIPPSQYKTTEKYVAYVDYLARNNFIVFKIDFTGWGKSEGVPEGSYFSPNITKDIINAYNGLNNFKNVKKDAIGIWGHSMSGNAVLRALEVNNNIKAGVIWAGAVYSYFDLFDYGIDDVSYDRAETSRRNSKQSQLREIRDILKLDDKESKIVKKISLTQNIDYLKSPLQIHHSINDFVVRVDYSQKLVEVLKDKNKEYEYFEYPGGGHNIAAPYLQQAMQRTVEFFNKYLK